MGASSVGLVIQHDTERACAHGTKVEAQGTLRPAPASRNSHILPISYVVSESLGSAVHADTLQLYYTIGDGLRGSVAEKSMS